MPTKSAPAKRDNWWRWVGGGALYGVVVFVLSRVDTSRPGTAMIVLAAIGLVLSAGIFLIARELVRRIHDIVYRLITWIRARQMAQYRVAHTYISHDAAEAWGVTQSLNPRDATAQTGVSAPKTDRCMRQRLAVGVMTGEFERSLAKSCLVLALALAIASGYAFLVDDQQVKIVAALTAAYFLLAVFRQAVLAWRTANGYFGSREHEVRELIAFAMKHPTPEDFFDDSGHLLPAFDLRADEVASDTAVGETAVRPYEC